MAEKFQKYIEKKKEEIEMYEQKIQKLRALRCTAEKIRENIFNTKRERDIGSRTQIGDFEAKSDPVMKKLSEVKKSLGFGEYFRHSVISPLQRSIRYRKMNKTLYDYLNNHPSEEIAKEVETICLIPKFRNSEQKEIFKKSYLKFYQNKFSDLV